jgi:DNA-binding GntR family transcriptional regulator
MYDVPTVGLGLLSATKSLESAVYETIRDRIIKGELHPGDPLVEAQLSEEFGISKTPVREALISLSRDGLVDQPPRKKSRVATPTERDIKDACELRTWIEGEIAAGLARDPDPDVLARLAASIDSAVVGLGKRSRNQYAEGVRAFSDILIESTGNRYANELLSRLRNILTLIANVSEAEPGRRERSIKEHRAILAAIEAGDADAARRATVEHMRSIADDSLHAIRTLATRS